MRAVGGHLHFFFFLFLLVLPRLVRVAGTFESKLVNSLPGFLGPLPFHLETGYIGVDESNDVQLFYYFIESERNPKEDPLVLWLTGGPGCSAFSGLVYEIGPLRFNIVECNGSLPTFSLNPYSWTKVSNIIFLDAPVGTGFSYSESSQGWKSSDTKSSKQIYNFLRKWLNNHPEFNTNPLYIAGDSYSGIVVPIIVQEIANDIEVHNFPNLNLKGYVLGNPKTDESFDENSKIPFAHQMALISDELYESVKRSCNGNYVNVDSTNIQCVSDLQQVSKCTERIKEGHILERNCIDLTKETNRMEENRRSLNDNLIPPIPLPEPGCRAYGYLFSTYWANDDSVREALHIKKGTMGRWKRCNFGITYISDVPSTVPYHLNLSTRGYRALIYSGDHDMSVPHSGTEAWIKFLNFSIVDDWRPWFVDDQVAGYTRAYSNDMTFATVKGAGHTAPEYRPMECLDMFKKWLSKKPL